MKNEKCRKQRKDVLDQANIYLIEGSIPVSAVDAGLLYRNVQ